MKKRILATTLSLAMSLTFIGPSIASISNTAYASGINTSSRFYTNRKTRQAYINLTDQQRAELERIDTNGNGLITIAEVLASGRYNLPIKKGVDFLYPFMIDSDNDGEVGENYVGNGSSSTNKIIDTNPVIKEAEDDKEASEIDEKEAIKKSNEKDQAKADKEKEEISNKDQGEKENPVKEGLSEEEVNRLKKVKLSLNQRDALLLAVKKANIEIDSAEYLMENFPKTIEGVRDKLENIIIKSKKLLEKAEIILNN